VRRKLISACHYAWLSGLLAPVVTVGLSLPAGAQTVAEGAQKPEIVWPASAKTEPAGPTPSVTIGAVRVSSGAANSAASSEPTP